MNLFSLFSRGVALSGVNERTTNQLKKERDDAVASTRAKWLQALLTDQIRAWQSIGNQDRGALTGLIAVLTLAGLSKAFDDRHDGAVEVRIIRGAISAAEQCASAADCVISHTHALAFSSAARVAVDLIQVCSAEAICYAAAYLNKIAGTGAMA